MDFCDNMARILFMHQASFIGGGSYCLLNIIKSLDKKLFEPIVALKSEGPLAYELRKLGVEVMIFHQMAAIPYNRRLLKMGSLMAYWKIRKSIPALKVLLKEKRIDVLYLNNMMLCRYLQPAKECGCKTVIHVREHWPLDEHKVQLNWARRCVYNYADKMIAINHYSASMFPRKDATIIYDWIDFSNRYEYRPLDEIFREDTSKLKVYLFTGGGSPLKGAYEIVKTFKEVIKDENCRLLILGLNIHRSKGIRKWIKRLLRIIGFTVYGDKLDAMRRDDPRIVCIPATYSIKHIIEQSYCMLSYFTIPHANLALAESIILGTPVVAADTEEAREYSLDGNLALLFPFKNITAFSKAVYNLDHDYEFLKIRINSDKAKIRMMFDPEINIRSLHILLKDLI